MQAQRPRRSTLGLPLGHTLGIELIPQAASAPVQPIRVESGGFGEQRFDGLAQHLDRHGRRRLPEPRADRLQRGKGERTVAHRLHETVRPRGQGRHPFRKLERGHTQTPVVGAIDPARPRRTSRFCPEQQHARLHGIAGVALRAPGRDAHELVGSAVTASLREPGVRERGRRSPRDFAGVERDASIQNAAHGGSLRERGDQFVVRKVGERRDRIRRALEGAPCR
ncbi:MAG: hypothetical protein ACJLS2_13250 [Microcella pacifica]